MPKLVTIYGGSGFVGRYIVQRMAHAGWRVRVAVRNPNEAIFLKPYGNVGQVAPVTCNIRDDDSVRSVIGGSDAVVNCVGLLAEQARNTFQAVQAEGPERVARIAKEEGIPQMVQISAIGADANSSSEYARTKAAGEQGVLDHMPQAMILRPSIIFGPGDSFFNRFAQMAKYYPIVPLVGAKTKFQPVYVEDVAHAADLGITGNAPGGIYELGGPDVNTFKELMTYMLKVIHRKRGTVNLPFWLASPMAKGMSLGEAMTLHLIKAPITPDQVEQLRHDNVVAPGAKGFKELGIAPQSMEAILPDYLWRFRPSGQYDAIKQSAQNLRGGGGRAGFS